MLFHLSIPFKDQIILKIIHSLSINKTQAWLTLSENKFTYLRFPIHWILLDFNLPSSPCLMLALLLEELREREGQAKEDAWALTEVVVKLLHHRQNNEIRKYFSVCVHRKERAPVNKIPLCEILNQSKSILYKLQLIWIALVHTVHYLPAIYVIAA